MGLEGALYLPSCYLTLPTERDTLFALNCDARAFRFTRFVRTSSLEP